MRLPCSLWVGNIYETPTTALCRGAMPGSWSKRHSSTAGVGTILTTVITTVEATRSIRDTISLSGVMCLRTPLNLSDAVIREIVVCSNHCPKAAGVSINQ